jgi:hypothetical protein
MWLRAQLPAIVDNASRKVCHPGERVVTAGERSESMFIVCSGRLQCEVKGVEVRQLAAGDSFGEVAVFAFRTWVLHREHAELLGNATALESLYGPPSPIPPSASRRAKQFALRYAPVSEKLRPAVAAAAIAGDIITSDLFV